MRLRRPDATGHAEVVPAARCGPQGRAARDLVGDADREIVVAAQECERAAALRLCDRLRPQVRGADRVRVGHDVRTAVLVAADREREAEGEDQPDHAEQGALQGTDRLAIPLRMRAHGRPTSTPRALAPPITRMMSEPELPTAQPEEHCARKLGQSADGAFQGAMR